MTSLSLFTQQLFVALSVLLLSHCSTAAKPTPPSGIRCPYMVCTSSNDIDDCVLGLKNKSRTDFDTCEGKYCVEVETRSRGKVEAVEYGCVSGDMLPELRPEKCQYFPQTEGDKKSSFLVCSCKGEDDCILGISENDKIEHRRFNHKVVSCHCDDCLNNDYCEGNYCSYSETKKGARKNVRSCVMDETPYIDNFFSDACVEPPIITQYEGQPAIGAMFTTVCTCKGKNCNAEKPKDHRTTDPLPKFPCKKSLMFGAREKLDDGTTLVLDAKLEGESRCSGEHCYRAEVSANSGSMKFVAEGCVSYLYDKPEYPLKNFGCLNAKIGTDNIQVCLCNPKENNGTCTMKKPNKKSVDRGGGGGGGAPPKGETHGKGVQEQQKKGKETDDDAIEEGGNTTIIAVFVVVMVIIVIAGVVWKFELHKKIFQSRYQTVSG